MTKKWAKILGVILFLVMVANDCTQKKEQVDVIAQAGNAVLTTDDLEKLLPKIDSLTLSKEQIQSFIKRWVERELIYQEAMRSGFTKNPNLQRDLENISKDYIVAQYIDQKINNEITISEAEIKAYYDENIDEFKCYQDEYHIKLILVATYNEANDIRRQIRGKEDFSQLAKKRSLDGSRLKGGDLGFVPLSRLSPILARTVVRLKKGELSEPIKSEVGYNILFLEDRREKGSVLPLEEVRFIIEERLLAAKRANNYHQFLTKLFEKASVKTDFKILDFSERKMN